MNWVLISKLLCNLPWHSPSPLHSFTVPSAVPSRTLALWPTHSYLYCFFRYGLQVFALTQTWLSQLEHSFPAPSQGDTYVSYPVFLQDQRGGGVGVLLAPFCSFLSPMWAPLGLTPSGFSSPLLIATSSWLLLSSYFPFWVSFIFTSTPGIIPTSKTSTSSWMALQCSELHVSVSSPGLILIFLARYKWRSSVCPNI